LFAVTACEHEPTSSAHASLAEISPAPAPTELEALRELTRGVALALSDPGLRNRVKNDLRASHVTVEHKLHFGNYLHGQNGGLLLAKMAKATGLSGEDVLALVNRVRPLEFYMPVAAHRESWTGGPDLWVGSLLEDHTRPVVFDLTGKGIDVPVDAIPAQPTLALVPIETDFSRPLSHRDFHNRNDRNGDAIGTLSLQPPAPDCDPAALQECGAGTGSGTTPRPHGLYYTAANLLGVGEGGLKGNPEIEVHVIRSYDPNRSTASAEPPFPSCQAGETRTGYRYFNQDAELWSGNALVLDSAQLLTFLVDPASAGSATRGYTVQLWEDDTDPCALRTDIHMDEEFSRIAGGSLIILFGVTKTTMGEWDWNGTWPYRVGFVALGAWTIAKGWAFFGSNDEYLGTAVERSSVSAPGYEGYTHILIRQQDIRNGAITLVNK
jgi:hypothetical protein